MRYGEKNGIKIIRLTSSMIPKKIFLIIPEFGYGGAEKSFSLLSVALAKKFDVSIIIFNKENEATYPISGDVISLDIPASNNFFSKLFYFYLRIRRLKKIKKRIMPDVSISFLEGADYINVLSKKNEKVILSIRGSKFNDENIIGITGWFRRYLLMPILYKKAHALVTVNNGIKKEMSKFISPDKITTIYNGYDIEEIEFRAHEEIPIELSELNSKNLIVSVGRLSPEKGFQHLLKVFKEVKLVNNSVKLVIVGSGNMDIELIKLCKKLDLEYDARKLGFDKTKNPDVLFLGYSTNPLPILKMASIFTLCSSAEGFPNALIEAMAIRVPVISTDCPYGPAEILAGKLDKRVKGKVLNTKFGILAPLFNEPNSINEWSRCIIDLLDDHSRFNQLSQLGYERAKDFTSEELISKWESIIVS